VNHPAKLLAALVLTLPLGASAADPLPKQVADLQCLVGSWKGGGSMTMGKDSAKVSASWSCKRTSAQFGVLCTLRVTGMPGGGAYEETDLLGYEPNTNTYHWYAVTNAGETHDHVAPVAAGDTFSFVFNGSQEGKPLKEVIDLTFAGGKTVKGRAETLLAGNQVALLQLELHK